MSCSPRRRSRSDRPRREGQVTADIAHVSPETKVVSHVMDFRDPWDFEHVYEKLHAFAISYPFDPDKEDYLVHITTGTHVAQICLFLLTESRHFPARLLQTSPGERTAQRPGNYAIIDLDLSKYDRLAARFQTEKAEARSLLKSGIETKNAAFNALIERIEQVSIGSRAPILLTGPTGAGKSKLARRIFELKKARRQVSGQLAELNCATLRGDAAMSTLFGHTKGAFTGATTDRPGLLRKADKGLLFLDEVAELGVDDINLANILPPAHNAHPSCFSCARIWPGRDENAFRARAVAMRRRRLCRTWTGIVTIKKIRTRMLAVGPEPGTRDE